MTRFLDFDYRPVLVAEHNVSGSVSFRAQMKRRCVRSWDQEEGVFSVRFQVLTAVSMTMTAF
jgi:hypothetical protein